MSVIKSGVIIAAFTMVSRILGLVRELVIANLFGTTLYADAVNTAFKLPNLFRRIFGEGALASVFVPIYSSAITQNNKEADDFASEVFTILLLTLVIFTFIMQIFMPNLMIIFAPGFHNDNLKFDLTVSLCRITVPYIIFISLAALIGGMLNSHKKFASFAIAPVLLNIAVIAGGLIPHDISFKAEIVAWSIIIGGIMQLIFMIIAAKKVNIHFGLVNPMIISRNSRKFLKNMLPATMSNGVVQVNLFISQSISSFIPGAISILSYADRLYQLPLSIIGICFSTVLLPLLSRLYKEQKYDEAVTLQTDAVKLSLLLSLPCMGGLIALSHPIIYLIYEHGAFTPEDTIKTAQAISAFALGLPAFVLGKIITPIFYAKLDVRTPFKITVYTIICNIGANLIFMYFFNHIGIALGTSFSSWFNIVLSSYYCRKLNIKLMQQPIILYGVKTITATIIMGLTAYYLAQNGGGYIYNSSTLTSAMALGALILLSFSLYILISFILGIFSVKQIKMLINKERR